MHYLDKSVIYIRDKIIYNNKKYTLGYNQITNLNYHIKNSIKKEFYKIYSKKVKKLKLKTMNKVIYEVYSNNNRRFDLLNIISIIDKFLLDLLVKENILTDDNVKVINNYDIKFIGINKKLKTRVIKVRFE